MLKRQKDGTIFATMISEMPAGVIRSCSSVPASRSFTIVVDAVTVPFMMRSVPKRPVTMNQVVTPPGLYRSVGCSTASPR